ncbi:cadherin-like beta sandwich domain-containing protein [Paenibacillus sp. FA6]|uniref:cadherin-like beta sandwich domain-containing protein n=1 Tax=Paenibacillus sp. FA6 TaxID=3413029 RepID=UPI003F659B99
MMRWSLLGINKLMICLLVLAVITLGLWTGGSIQEVRAATTLEGLEYEIRSSGVTITGYTGTNKDVIIPTTIEGSPVTSIGVSAFFYKQLTSVAIPASVTSIGISAFNSNQLTSVMIPGGVTSIEPNAFRDNQLASVTIPEGVTSIGSDAFRDNQLASVTIPEGVTSIGSDAFNKNRLTSVKIPASVTSIGDYAFRDNRLTSVTIPDGVTSIGNYVFATNQLASVTIPASVTSIGAGAFRDNRLTSVTIPDGVTSIGSYVFDTNQLASVTIPDGVTSIGAGAFSSNQLASVTIPDGVTSIGDYAFSINQLMSVTIPAKVTSIGASAFSINQLTSVMIPDGVTSIGAGAFYKNQLASVTIPASVTSIGASAFSFNELTSVMVEGDSTAIGTDAFGSSENTSMIAFDPSPAKTYASEKSHKYLNILSAGVSYSPNGESLGKEQISTKVMIKVPDAVLVKAEYKWSKSDTTASWNIGEGTTFYSGDTITTPTATGDWYLHVRVDDEVHSESYSHSNAFKVLGPLSNNADLSSLSLSSGSLSPTFASGTITYTASVVNSVSNLTVTPAVADSGATVTVNGTTVVTGMESGAINLNVGSRNPITIVVTAQDGATTKTYTLNVTRASAPLSSNADLSSLVLSSGSLSPTFASGTTTYTASVANSVSNLTVAPAVADSGATVKVNGTEVATGAESEAIDLNVGSSNPITIVVTAQDGATTKTYTLNVTRASAPLSSNADLSSLVLSSGSLSPTFASGTITYTTSVGNSVSNLTVTPAVADSGATVTVNGTTVVTGMESGAINLNVGSSNPITIVVTAQDGATTKTYTLNVTRASAPLSNNADLSSLVLSSGSLSPTFALGTITYTTSVGNSVSNLTVTPAVADSGATVTVNGTTVVTGMESGAINLNVGSSNPITIVVTAQDGATTKTYTLNVTRASAPLSNNADLSSLLLSSGSLSPTFASGTITYTASVGNSVSNLTVTPAVADSGATVTVNGIPVVSGSASGVIGLSVGSSNTITVVVTAQDGVTTKTYTLNVTRASAPLSSNADLSSLVLSSGSLSPTFASGTITYTASVGNSISNLTVTPAVADSGATVTVNGTEVATGAESEAIDLNVGDNTITVITTAQDGTTTKTYTITVTRAATPLSNNADLSSLGLTSGILNPVFASGTTGYTVNVDNSVSNMKVTPAVATSTAIVTVNGVVVTSGAASGAISLSVGNNTITVETIAEDGTTKQTYTVIVTRASASISDGGSEGSPSSGGSPTIPSTDDSRVLTSTDGKITLPIGSAGEVSLPNAVTIVIPAGTSDKELKITIEELTDAKDPLFGKLILISPIYEILKNFTEDLAKPVRLTFIFDPSSLKEDQYPAVFYYDEVKKEWVQIEGGKIDGNKITVEVNFFAKFAVMAVSKEEQSGTDHPTFSDITGHWAASDINKAAQRGIVNGYKDGTFKPNGVVTRAEFVVMLMKALKPQEEDAKLTFTDSAKIGTWAIDAIEQAVKAGIVTGYLDGSFRPNAEITRAEMAMMIAKALALKVEANTITDFVDEADIPSWAKAPVAALKSLGLITGKGTNKFAPNANATRAEAVTILLKVIAQESK